MSDRFDKFTERAKKALMLAQEEAVRFNHNYIGTEHLLIGVAAEGQGVGARLLKTYGVDLPRLREVLTFIIGRGKDPVEGDISLTPRAKLVVDRAIEEARVLRHGYVGTEHLLLGAAHPGIDGISVRMLEHCGVDVHALRRATLDLLASEAQRLHGASGESGTPPPATARPRDNVVTCRVDDQTLGALDALVEAGVHSTRSEAAARLILAGIQANQPLFQRVNDAVAEIRRVRAETQALVRMWEEGGSVESAPAAEAGEASREAESEQRENRDAGRKRPDAGQIREAEPGTQQAGA
jgi:hypothetical protein